MNAAHTSQNPILPGQTLGILGGGQLGRMLAMVARRCGYRVHVFTPETNSPASFFADQTTIAEYGDERAFRDFASQIDVLTLEFENVSAAALNWVPPHVPVRPDQRLLLTAQDRSREKTFLREHQLPTPPFALVHSRTELEEALKKVPTPAVLKTSSGGYDGKGQFRIDSIEQIDDAWLAVGKQPATLEAFVDLACEVSVIVARDVQGNIREFGPIENQHRNHILDMSFIPSSLSPSLAEEASSIARQIATLFDLVGLICVEFFVTRDGQVLVNEIAPRTHNSGHLTIEAFTTSQFEQQLRAVCGLALGDTTQTRPAAMVNLLGDLWQNAPPAWDRAMAVPEAALHLYDKREPRCGRKMGHITASGPDVATAVTRALAARNALTESSS